MPCLAVCRVVVLLRTYQLDKKPYLTMYVMDAEGELERQVLKTAARPGAPTFDLEAHQFFDEADRGLFSRTILGRDDESSVLALLFGTFSAGGASIQSSSTPLQSRSDLHPTLSLEINGQTREDRTAFGFLHQFSPRT